MRKKHGGLDALTLWAARAVLVGAGGVLALLYSQITSSISSLETFQKDTIARLASIEAEIRHVPKVH